MGASAGFEEFVSIVERGSVTAASAALGVSRPTLSRRLAGLEERLGVRLLHRTTRRMKLTQHGEALYNKARLVVQAAREAEAEVRRLDGVPRGLLRVSLPMGMPQEALGQWLADFLALCPEVEIELVASSAHVDLVAEGFDVALRAGPIEDPSLVVRTVVKNASIAVASPRYLDLRGTPREPEDLVTHNCIVGFRAGIAPEQRWPLRDGGSIPVSGTLKTNQMGLRVQAARRHLGIALVIDRFAEAAIDAGEIVPVLPERVGREERVALVYPDRTFLDPKVRAFVDFLAARLPS